MIGHCTLCGQSFEAPAEDALSPNFMCRTCYLQLAAVYEHRFREQIRREVQCASPSLADLSGHESQIVRFVLGSRHRSYEPVADLRKAIEQLTSSLAQVPPEEHALRAELEAMLTIINGAMSRHVRTEIAACETKAKD